MKKWLMIGFVAPLLIVAGCRNQPTETADTTSTTETATTSNTSANSTSIAESTERPVTSSTSVAEESDSMDTAEATSESAVTVADLDIDAINNDDFSSLVGTWKNGQGETLEIYSDGTTSNGYTLHGVPNSQESSKVPYATLANEHTSNALALFKIGFANPSGDRSDTTQPRILPTQQGADYPPELYFYRVE